MTDNDRRPITQYLRRLVGGTVAGGLTDAQLLERFVAQRDEAAFEVLVWRHGPMVLGVCRHVLRHEQEAEDAFQATFLVLVRKAKAIGRRESVGGWLYRVAYRVALRAKLLADKRTARQRPTADEPPARSEPDPAWGELRPTLDEEINHLPGKYRTTFILCYLDGKTNEEAARELGCPLGTVVSRLAWARRRLRARLTRRGLEPSSALPVVPPLALPPLLVESTLKAALPFAAGQAAADVCSANVAALTHGVLQTMLYAKLKIVAVCLLAAGALAVGGMLTHQVLNAGQPGDGPEVRAQPPNKPEPPKSDKAADKPDAPKAEEKTFEFDMRDKKWAEVFERYSEISGREVVAPNTPAGSFTFIPPKGKRYTLTEIRDIINEGLLAKHWLLIQGPWNCVLVPADEKVDLQLVPRVKPEELANLGKYDLVRVVVPLTKIKAKDVQEVRKLMGAFGTVTILESLNQAILLDTAGNLREIMQTIHEIEDHYAEVMRQNQKFIEAEKQKWLDAEKKKQDANKQ